MLLNLAVNMRMVAYAMETEKPSAAGLKLDLDRMRATWSRLRARRRRRAPRRFIASAKTAIAEAEKEARED